MPGDNKTYRSAVTFPSIRQAKRPKGMASLCPFYWRHHRRAPAGNIEYVAGRRLEPI